MDENNPFVVDLDDEGNPILPKRKIIKDKWKDIKRPTYDGPKRNHKTYEQYLREDYEKGNINKDDYEYFLSQWRINRHR